VQGDTLHTHYILHKDSLEDALFRMKLPVSEKQLFEQDSKFWKYLESLTK
jgi:mRNA interferase RelE/StbE